MQLVCGLLGDDVHHTTRCARAIAGSRRATDDFNALNCFYWHPVGVATGVTLAAAAHFCAIARLHGLAVNQDQGVFRAHATDVNLAVVAVLARGGVACQVDAGHGANQLRNVVGWCALDQFFLRDHRDAERLLEFLLGRGAHRGFSQDRVLSLNKCVCGQRDCGEGEKLGSSGMRHLKKINS